MRLSPQLRPPRAILFDWDNTLVDTWPTIVECYRDTFAALGLPPWTADEVRARAHGSLRDVFPGLWLDPAALIRGDLAHALKVLQQGLATPEHAAFIEQLQQKRPTT